MGRALAFLHACIGNDPKTRIYNVQHPRECYLLLEAQYGKPSIRSTFSSMARCTEIHYNGTSPVKHVECFKEAKHNWEKCGETAGPLLEMSLFLISIKSSPSFQPFL